MSDSKQQNGNHTDSKHSDSQSDNKKENSQFSPNGNSKSEYTPEERAFLFESECELDNSKTETAANTVTNEKEKTTTVGSAEKDSKTALEDEKKKEIQARIEKEMKRLDKNIKFLTDKSSSFKKFLAELSGMKHLKKLQMYPQITKIVLSVYENRVTVISAATGTGKTLITHAFHLFNKFLPSQFKGKGKKPLVTKMYVSQPTVLTAKSHYRFAKEKLEKGLKKDSRKDSKSDSDSDSDSQPVSQIGYRAGSREENIDGFLVYATTQTVLNKLIQAHFKEPKTLNSMIIMIDEAHHNSIEIYVLLATVNWLLSQGHKLRVIISSATLGDLSIFTQFANAHRFDIPGRSFKQTMVWNKDKLLYIDKSFGNAHMFSEDQIMIETSKKIIQAAKENPDGNIMVFAHGKNECYALQERAKILDLKENSLKGIVFIICHSDVETDELYEQIESTKGRICFILTDVGETGITFPDVVAVVDTLLHKKSCYDDNGFQQLQTVPITALSAKQRAGRAGRVRDGKAYYPTSEEGFLTLSNNNENAFYDTPLNKIILQMINYGLPPKEVLLVETVRYEKTIQSLLSRELVVETKMKKTDSDVVGNLKNPEPECATKTFKLTPLGKGVLKFQFLSISSSVALINALCDLDSLREIKGCKTTKSKDKKTKGSDSDDDSDKNEKSPEPPSKFFQPKKTFDDLSGEEMDFVEQYMMIVCSIIEARNTVSYAFDIPEMKNDKKTGEKLRRMSPNEVRLFLKDKCKHFIGFTDLDVFVNVFKEMFSDCSDDRWSIRSVKEWSRQNYIYYRFIAHAYNVFENINRSTKVTPALLEKAVAFVNKETEIKKKVLEWIQKGFNNNEYVCSYRGYVKKPNPDVENTDLFDTTWRTDQRSICSIEEDGYTVEKLLVLSTITIKGTRTTNVITMGIPLEYKKLEEQNFQSVTDTTGQEKMSKLGYSGFDDFGFYD